MTRCAKCRARGAKHLTVSSRRLCDSCNKQLAQYSGAGSSMVAGNGPLESITTGVASGAFIDAVAGEGAAIRKRREKLAQTRGFWRRLWVRVWG